MERELLEPSRIKDILMMLTGYRKAIRVILGFSLEVVEILAGKNNSLVKKETSKFFNYKNKPRVGKSRWH